MGAKIFANAAVMGPTSVACWATPTSAASGRVSEPVSRQRPDWRPRTVEANRLAQRWANSVTVQAVTGGLSSALTLTDSPPCCDLVLSSTTSFLSTRGKKEGKETPQGTNGSLTSLRGGARVRPGAFQPRELAASSFRGKMWHCLGFSFA